MQILFCNDGYAFNLQETCSLNLNPAWLEGKWGRDTPGELSIKFILSMIVFIFFTIHIFSGQNRNRWEEARLGRSVSWGRPNGRCLNAQTRYTSSSSF